MRSLSAKRTRCICGVHLLAGAVKEDYGAGPKMGYVMCRHVLPGVGSMGSPEGTDVRTGGPALGPTDRSLYFLLLTVERMLEPLLLPCEKTFRTKIEVVF
jgi:hypothetical protein